VADGPEEARVERRRHPVARPLVVAAAVLLVVVGATVAIVAHDEAPRAEAHHVIESGGLLLDVRSTDEFANGHLDGARNVPILELESRIAELPRDRPLVVYCSAGGRSAWAAHVLRARGFAVHDLGPMSRW
jgi:phage shock protein E